MPRSPWLASPGWTHRAGVPVEASVAAIFRAIWPLLPMPVTTTRPVMPASTSTERAKLSSRPAARSISASASTRSTRCATAMSLSADTLDLRHGTERPVGVDRMVQGWRTPKNLTGGSGEPIAANQCESLKPLKAATAVCRSAGTRSNPRAVKLPQNRPFCIKHGQQCGVAPRVVTKGQVFAINGRRYPDLPNRRGRAPPGSAGNGSIPQPSRGRLALQHGVQPDAQFVQVEHVGGRVFELLGRQLGCPQSEDCCCFDRSTFSRSLHRSFNP